MYNTIILFLGIKQRKKWVYRPTKRLLHACHRRQMHSSEKQQITQMSINMWVDREVFYPMKCYSAKKKRKVPIHEVMWMYLRNIMVSQRSQTQTAINTQCMVLFIESSGKDKNDQ